MTNARYIGQSAEVNSQPLPAPRERLSRERAGNRGDGPAHNSALLREIAQSRKAACARMSHTPLSARAAKRRCDFVTLVSQYTRLRHAGRQYVGRCPFHAERHPSCYFHPEKKIFHCFGCGCGGDVFAFVMRAEGCSFPRALEIVLEFSSGVARSGSPQSGEQFGVRVEGEALLARAAGELHSPDSRASILARLDETERVLAAIRRTNDAHSRLLATACESGERSEPFLVTNRITDERSCPIRGRVRVARRSARGVFLC